MFEIAKGKFILKCKIIGMKVVTKDNKFWVVFNLDTANKDENSAFSAPFATDEEANTFLQNCASKLV